MFSKLALFVAAAGVAFAATTEGNGTTGAKGDAHIVKNNPVGAAYGAHFAASNKSAIAGSVVAVTGPEGTGVVFAVSLNGFDTQQGPYTYHIHELPVPANGNCTATKAHLDPFGRGQEPPCDPSKPATCQTGDLSGKWGDIKESSFAASYVDNYLALTPEDSSYFGNLSFVIHNNKGDRVACTNFYKLSGVSKTEVCSGTATDNSSDSSSTSTPVFEGAASGYATVSKAAFAVAGAVGVLMSTL